MSLTIETDISKELRCLRMHLTPVLSDHYKTILKEAERRLKTGEVSTTPATFKKVKRIKTYSKRELVEILLNK